MKNGSKHYSGNHSSGRERPQGRYIPHYQRTEEQLQNSPQRQAPEDQFTDISSYSSGAHDSKNENGFNKKEKISKAKKKKIIVSAVCIFMALVFGIVGSGFIYVGNLFGSYIYDGTSQGANSSGNAPSKASPTHAQKVYDEPEIIDGRYHDDAVLNILLMGIDDYQEGDIGRTDSMMLVSIDRRHQELKVTSFMRDMYVNIPDGWAPNRINVAYTLGGPELLVDTIETNFKVDIDKYVQINYDAFEYIVNALGGVEIELSAEEAEVINEKSGETSCYVTEGVNNLTGKQARYYARIRKVSNEELGDYGRTLRQRIIITSIVNKFKSSNLLTITQLANEIVPLVKSDLTQEEILSIVTDALTYMNYDMQQCRIPSDEMHYAGWVTISGMDANVLIPDTEWNAIYLNEFVYGDTFPELAATLDYYGYSSCEGK